MANTKAKNVGAVITSPVGPVYQTNIFEGKQPLALPSNVPSPKGFVGRESDLSDLRQAKQEGKTAFVLHGQGGIGKTDLALQFVGEVKKEFQAHVKVDMRGLEKQPLSSSDAMLEIIRGFDPTVQSDLIDKDIQRLYLQLLNQHKTVVLLDNAKDREQVEPLNHSNGLLVITARTSFNVSGGFSLEVDQMTPEDAQALLYSVAGEARLAGNAEALASLARYLPMALLPLAGIIADDPTLEATDLIQKYKDRKELLRLADPNRGNLSVATSFDLSYERLADDLKLYWRRLAVFPSDFDLSAMESVFQDKNTQGIRSEFVKSHLLIFDAKTKRSRLHDLAREYAYEKLTQSELVYAQAYHAAHYGFVLTTIDSVSLDNLAIFDLERANIDTGFAFVRDKADSGFAEVCTLYTGYASDLYFLRMPMDMIFDWQSVGLLAYTKLEDLKGQAYSINNLARVLSMEGKHEESISHYKKALKIVREIGETRFEAAWLGNLGNVYMRMENYDEAAKHYQQAIEVSREIGDRRSEGRNYGLLGSVTSQLGNQADAVKYLKKALTFEEIDIGVKAAIMSNLGKVYFTMDNREKAIALTKDALALFEEMGSPSAQDTARNLELMAKSDE